MLVANLLLLLTAAIWGLGFVAQRLGMEFLGPFGFNGVRFLIGAVSMLPLIWWAARREPLHGLAHCSWLKQGLPVGLLLFAGASLQQVGMVYTTAAKAGFITGLYIILVPVLGLLLRHPTSMATWLGGALAVWGLYFLSIGDDFAVNFGDLLNFIGAFVWAAHLLWIDHAAKRVSAVLLAAVQFTVCGLLSLAVAWQFETVSWQAIYLTTGPLLYAGVVSVGVAYTLQIMAQKRAHPAHAAIILSLEAVFAAVGGVLILSEPLGPRAVLGCTLMLAGMLISQLPLRWLWKSRDERRQ